MRYIDADALIEVLQGWRDASSLNDGAGNPVDSILYDVIRHIEDAPTADVAPRAEWISVAERVPDCEYGAETEALLFRLKTGTVEVGYFGTGGRFRDKYFRCYHHANEGWDAKDVTHWMPLPEPPQGEKHDPS